MAWRFIITISSRTFPPLLAPYIIPQDGLAILWDEQCNNAFDLLWTVLTRAPILAYPDPSRPFIVDTDASDVGLP